MSFNVKKCKVMHFGWQNIRYDYTMNGSIIEKVSKEKDLGVWVEDDMSIKTVQSRGTKCKLGLGPAQ